MKTQNYLKVAVFLLFSVAIVSVCFAQTPFDYARNLVKDGLHELAIMELTNVLRGDPNNEDAYWLRAECLRSRGANHTAASDYDQVLRLNPRRTEAIFNRGLANLYAGNGVQAVADFNKASESGMDTRLQFGIRLSRELAAGQRHIFIFKAPGYGQVTVETHGSLDTFLTVFNDSGTQVGSDDDSGVDGNALLTFDVDRDSTYILEARFYNDSLEGPYQIQAVFNPTTH